MEIIHDLLWLWILGALGGTGYILWAVYVRDAAPARTVSAPPPPSTTRRTPSGPPPVARPAPPATPVPPSRLPNAPASEHQRRGSVPTVKLQASEPARPGADDQAAADLFSGLSEAKAKADAAPPISIPAAPQLAMPKGIVEQAERIEERGFHVGAIKTEPAAPAPARPTTEAKSEPVPGQPRSQTAELDDILKRIDAVLSESNAPQSEATMTGGGRGNDQTMPVAQSPPTEKLDRKATDPSQQKLF